jgi:ABC-type transport system involved in Fe-S cluster assembly fused permease/ATPase subunit
MEGHVCSSVVQAVGRRISYHALLHALDLDLHFHTHRQTGALVRIINRGAFERDLSLLVNSSSHYHPLAVACL